jgi:hypothetical protein
MDGTDVEPVQPGFLEGPPLALDLRLTGAVPDTRVDQDCPQAPTDQRKLFVGVTATIIDAIPISG